MKRLHETIAVPRELDDVFHYTANFSNIEQWDPGINRSRKITGGPLGEGSRFRLQVKTGPTTTEMDYVITRFEPPHRVVLEGTGGSVHAIDDIRFSAEDGITRVDYTAEITVSGLAGLFEPLLDKTLDRIAKNAMSGLKEALSAEPEPPGNSCARNLMDRLLLPGALGFTRFGYTFRRRSWHALPVSLAGQRAVVTGATSGLGRITAEKLAELGAHVIIVGRDENRLAAARDEIAAATGSDRLQVERADLGLMAQVRALADRLLATGDPIHLLINNAAVLPDKRTLTSEGLETAFATDLLSPYLLTELLIPRLKESAPARIINVLSGGMYLSGLEVEDLEFERGRYDGSLAYARAKRGLMVLTERWAGELAGDGITVHAMHPGWADTPGVRTSLPGFHKITRAILRTPEQGADTMVWLAAAPEAGKVTGKFWLDREPHLSAVLPGTAGTPVEREQLIDKLSRLAA
jgi:NAD(P)-dependent dehydrogenase (short-subunit alcohol dehydrogenase family)/carbon monoxide dehydrogenase subunit G